MMLPGSRIFLDVDPGFEHGVLVDQGEVEACGARLQVADLAYQEPGRLAGKKAKRHRSNPLHAAKRYDCIRPAHIHRI